MYNVHVSLFIFFFLVFSYKSTFVHRKNVPKMWQCRSTHYTKQQIIDLFYITMVTLYDRNYEDVAYNFVENLL